MEEKYYRPSGRYSWKGIILMFLTYLVVGTGLSWVYLWINRISPSPYLCIFAAIGFGVAVGLIARLCVKIFKVRNVMAVLIGAIAGLICMNYLKWAIYDYYDYKQYAEEYEEYINENISSNPTLRDMKAEMAYTYFEMNLDFDETEYTFDENYDYLTQTNAYDYLAYYEMSTGVEILSQYTESEIAEIKTQTVYELFDYDRLLGTTKEECKKNLEKAKNMSAFEFYYEYRALDDDYTNTFEVPSLTEIITHPGMLWDDIKQINKEGRWSISSTSSTAAPSKGTAFNGIPLLIVWICEFLIISLISFLIPIGQSKKVFIEMDNEWARHTDPNVFTFGPMSKAQVKAMLEQSPDNIANMLIVHKGDVPMGRPYMKMTLDHSRDYTEAYLNVLSMTYNAKNRNYVSTDLVKGLRIRPKHVGMLFTIFGLEVPARIAADGEFYSWDMARNEYARSMQAQQSVQPSSYVAPNRDGGLDMAAYEAWRNARHSNNNDDFVDI